MLPPLPPPSSRQTGKLVQCTCTKCRRTDQGHRWIASSTKSDHIAADKRIRSSESPTKYDGPPPTPLAPSPKRRRLMDDHRDDPGPSSTRSLSPPIDIPDDPLLDIAGLGSDIDSIFGDEIGQDTGNNLDGLEEEVGDASIEDLAALRDLVAALAEGQATGVEQEYQHILEVSEDEPIAGDLMDSFIHHDLPEHERMAYTQAAFLSISGAHVPTVTHHLEYANTQYELTNGSPPDNGTSNPFEAYARLGVDPDSVMLRYAVCEDPTCCYIHLADDLKNLKPQDHTRPHGELCSKPIFTMDKGKRRPIKILTFTPPSVMIRCFLRDPEFVEHLQHWRQPREDDGIGEQSPMTGPVKEGDKVMTSIFDGQAWRTRDANAKRMVNEQGQVKEVSAHPVRLVSREFGLLGVINLDWFAVKDVKNCSIGAIYISILNLPRYLCFKRQWTILSIVIPGDREPSLTALNRIIQPLVEDLKRLESGILANVAGRAEKQLVQLQILFTACDLPASRKLSGNLGFGSKRPCNHCGVTKAEVETVAGYQEAGADGRDGWSQLQQAFLHKRADKRAQKALEATYQVRYSSMINLVGFDHSLSCPPETMHGAGLGMTRALVSWMIKVNMFADKKGNKERSEVFDNALDTMTWPSHIGRLSINIVKQLLEGGDGRHVKADEWNRIRAGLPLALWLAWRIDQESDDIDDGVKFGLVNRAVLYRAVLDFVAALRTLLARTVTMNDAIGAQVQLRRAARSFADLGMPLTINWHISLHYCEFIRQYGPAGSFAGWAFERNNGYLARAKYFKGDRLQLTSTACRLWNKDQLLRMVLSNPAPNASDAERRYLSKTLEKMNTKIIQGTLLVDEYRANAANFRISLPTALRKQLDLTSSRHNLYAPTLLYVQRLCAGRDFTVKSIWDVFRSGIAFQPAGQEEFGSAKFNGFRFTSESYTRSKRDRWALALDQSGHRAPCRIEVIFRLVLPDVFGNFNDTDIVLAAVRFMNSAKDEVTPWSHVASQIGQEMLHMPDVSSVPTIIPVCSLQAPLAVQLVKTINGPRVVTVSFDKDGPEPEDFIYDDDESLDA